MIGLEISLDGSIKTLGRDEGGGVNCEDKDITLLGRDRASDSLAQLYSNIR